jgi:hypothetical protein
MLSLTLGDDDDDDDDDDNNCSGAYRWRSYGNRPYIII